MRTDGRKSLCGDRCVCVSLYWQGMRVWFWEQESFLYVFSVLACTHGFGCRHVLVWRAKGVNPMFWDMVASPAAVTDRLLCSFSKLVTFFSRFLFDAHLQPPYTLPPNPPPKHPHTQEASAFFFYPAVAHSLYRAYCFQRENSVHLKERRWKQFNDL